MPALTATDARATTTPELTAAAERLDFWITFHEFEWSDCGPDEEENR